MSEMLGNHYFLVRNYQEAIKSYSRAFDDNLPKTIVKKLIICHLTQDNFQYAKNYFLNLIQEDPAIIYKTDNEKEECPCYELIEKYEAYTMKTADEIIRLGILWFYCDLDTSKKYFQRVVKINSNNKYVQEVIDIINTLTEKKTKG